MLVFPLELAVEPAGQISERFGDGIVRIGGHVLTRGAVAIDRDGYAMLVIVASPVGHGGSELVEVAPLNGLEGVGDPVKRGIRWCIVSDAAGGGSRMSVVAL